MRKAKSRRKPLPNLVPSAHGLVPRSHNAPPVTFTDEPPVTLTDDQVLRFDEWCRLNAISLRTGRRILASGDGPTVTRLSAQRIGITVGNNRRWQETRAQQ
jgi:hypothetical protein